MTSNLVQKQIEPFISGAAYPAITETNLNKTLIPLPPLPVQEQIVEKLEQLLNRIDLAIEKLENNIQLTDQLFASSLNQAFNPLTTPTQADGTYQLPENWEWKKLSELTDLKNGQAFKSKDYLEQSNTKLIRMGNIRPGGFFDENHKPVYLPDNFKDKYSSFILEEGDLIVAMTDLAQDIKILGLPTLVKKSPSTLLLNQRVGKLEKVNLQKININFLKYAMRINTVQQHFKSKGGGGLQINIGKKDLLGAQIPLPPLPAQETIIEKLDLIQEKTQNTKQTLEQKIHQLQQLKSSLLNDAFRGKL